LKNFLFKCLKVLFPPSPYNASNLQNHLFALPEKDGIIYVIWVRDQDYDSSFKDKLLQTLHSSFKSSNNKVWLKDNSFKKQTMKSRPRHDGSQISSVIFVEKEMDLVEYFLKTENLQYVKYEVKNSIPLDSGFRTAHFKEPVGIVSMSFFQAKPKLSTNAFHEYWFNSHTPFALDIHPLTQYERNKVTKQITQDASNFQGIVPLSVNREEDLDPKSFFTGDGKSMFKNMLRILADVNSFLDLNKIETIPMREYRFDQSD
jgi:hypothetical protein